MDELVKVNYESDRPTVSARELYAFLEVKTDFRHWFDRMAEYGFTENVDFARLVQKCPTLGGMQEIVDYQLTLEMAKELCMIQRNEKGKQARAYFIQLEKDWNSSEKVMARALQIANCKLHNLSTQIEQDKPKVTFANAVTASKTSILVGELAKILKQNGIDTGEHRLFAWMRSNGYLIRRKGTDYNAPTQRSMSMGLFEVKESTVTHYDGSVTVTRTTKVTGKGQEYFINQFLRGK